MKPPRSAVLGSLAAVLATAAVVAAQSSPGFNLARSVLGGGGGRAASSGFAVHGTLGQALAGPVSGPTFHLSSGFWWPVGVATATPTPAGSPAPTATRTARPTATGTRTPTRTPQPTATGGPSATPAGGSDIWLPAALKLSP
jgi:hypothetical protein